MSTSSSSNSLSFAQPTVQTVTLTRKTVTSTYELGKSKLVEVSRVEVEEEWEEMVPPAPVIQQAPAPQQPLQVPSIPPYGPYPNQPYITYC